MENATKALLISAGVLLAVMILSLLMIAYNQISAYYNARHEATMTEQLTEFNARFEDYNRKNIRGNDILSFINKVIDYNQREVYADGTHYRKMELTIEIGNSHLDEFKFISSSNAYNYPFTYTSKIPQKITNVSGGDIQLTKITDTVNDIINTNTDIGITEAKLQTLSSNIENIVFSTAEENGTDEYSLQRRADRIVTLRNILQINDAQINANLRRIEQITCQYYEITNFKRALFDCTNVEYDKNTGRIYKMNFEVVTKNGLVVFN